MCSPSPTNTTTAISPPQLRFLPRKLQRLSFIALTQNQLERRAFGRDGFASDFEALFIIPVRIAEFASEIDGDRRLPPQRNMRLFLVRLEHLLVVDRAGGEIGAEKN